MDSSGSEKKNIEVELSAERACRLGELAKRRGISEERAAEELLVAALESEDSLSKAVFSLLDSIPGAGERAQRGNEEAKNGRGIPLEDL